MERYRILVNPTAKNRRGFEKAKNLNSILDGDELVYTDMTAISDYRDFFNSLEKEDKIIIAGGDGTLNRFVNDTLGIEYCNDIYLYGCGTGNDFLNDIGADIEKPVLVNRYIVNLPIVEVNGKKYKFINGVGFGLDGYCCEEGDKVRANGKKDKVDYTKIAIKGLAYDYKRRNATVTIDGVEHKYSNVWICPTMNGRYYGGGMMATPTQDRLNADGKVTLSPMHCRSKIKTMIAFPLIFSGKHILLKDIVDIQQGYKIHVRFDKYCALQIDGETIPNVIEYNVDASKEARACRNPSLDLNREFVGAK